jgi:hypothetical protein
MDYFSQMIKEGKNVTEDKKNAEWA